MLCITQVYAQNRTVTGTVTSKEDGLPIPGVTVKVKGSTLGAQTTASGKFILPNVPANATLVFTYVGYVQIEQAVKPTGAIDVSMESNNTQLGEVVVTGTLGRKVEEKATGYASTHLSGTETNESAETNLLTGLTGKVAGLNVSTTGTGVDAAIKIDLRGQRSINGNNAALIVVDGVPLPNGDISSIDPNTIESYDILNGGSAGVLYGSEASNGVIVITTKKGSANGKPTVTYSNSVQAMQPAYYPKIQTQYGQNGGENLSEGGINALSGLFQQVPYENQLYGPAFDGHMVTEGAPAGSPTGPTLTLPYSSVGKNPFQQFYQTGIIEQNNIAVSSGNADDYFNMSAQNALQHGNVPGDVNNRYSATFKGGKRYGIFKAEYSLTYTNTEVNQAGGSYFQNQPIAELLLQIPANIPLSYFKDSSNTSLYGNTSDFYDAYATNPYWNVANSRSITTRNVLLANVNLTLSPTKYLDINYKLTDNIGFYDNRTTKAEVDFTPYSVKDPLGAGNVPSGTPGGIIPATVSDTQATGDGSGTTGLSRLQQDVIVSLHPTLSKDFKTNLLLGSTIWDQHEKFVQAGATQLFVTGLYNLNYNGGTPTANEGSTTINQISYFGDATIGYKDYAFIDGSIRHEADSRLSTNNQNYWYPGVSGSFVFTDAIDALKNNKVLSYGKLRVAYSITGQVNVNAYQINNTYSTTGGGFPFGSLPGLSASTTNYTNIVPERVTEIEFGTELGFFDNVIHGSFTYYKQNDRNQTLSIGTSPSTGYSAELLNVGQLQSSGFEAGLTVSPLTKAKNRVGLDVGATLTNTESKVISLLPNIPQFNISGGSGNQYAIVGQPFPEVKGTDYQRDPATGQVVVSSTTGLPLTNQTQIELGRTSPEWMLGLHADVSYKFLSFNVVAEYRTGYVADYTNGSTFVFGGASAYTTQNGREPGIYPNSVYVNSAGAYVPNTNISTADGNYKYWQNSTVGGTNAPTSPFVTSGAFWKIREANLGFNLNQFVKNSKYIKGLKFSLTGRNLFIWVPKTNFWGDPEVSGTGNGDTSNATSSPGLTNPSARIFGAKLDVTF